MLDKIAYIATFHCVPNYGAVLQAFGLQEYLKSLFTKVYVLDYRPDSLLHEYKNINTFSLASIGMSLWSLPSFLRKKRAFKNFEQRLNLSQHKGVKPSEFALWDADYIFLGSDQIWNPDVTKGFDPVFFGDIKGKATLKRISYAASIGKSQYTKAETEQMSNLLSRIDVVSVRETEAKSILATSFNVDSKVVADPTILAGADVFIPLVSNVPYNNYVFVYTLCNNPNTLRIAKEVADKKGLKIVQVNGNRKGLKTHPYIVLDDVGPEYFLSLLYHADCVVTDSFHGTVFSNIFHRPYITIPHKTRGGRMVTLLTGLGMMSQLSEAADAIDNDIDWTDVETHMTAMRNKSIEFIRNSI